MPNERFDLLVIGAGSGGVRAARFAGGFGAKVAVVEARELGGTCVHRGCIPKKLLVYAAEYAGAFEDARGFGWDVDVRGHTWASLRDAKDRELARLGQAYRGMLERAGVRIVEGLARFESPTSVRVDATVYEADKILVSTGGYPLRGNFPGAELGITSDEAFHLPSLPKSIVILGAGYIALEFASIFRGLGAEVHVVHRGPVLLKRFDDDVQAHLATELERRGIHLHLGAYVVSVERDGDGLQVNLRDREPIRVDTVMHALGRAPNTSGLRLDAAGVAVRANGAVIVDDAFATNVPSVFAVGDVIDRVQLTPVALGEGMWFARKHFGGIDPRPLDYARVPTAVFTLPNVGTVGMTEREAREAHEVRIYRSTFTPMRHTLSGRGERVMMKLVVDATSDRVLGVHVVGADAGEIVQGFAVAMTAGATKAQLDDTLGIHPTAAEELVTMREPIG